MVTRLENATLVTPDRVERASLTMVDGHIVADERETRPIEHIHVDVSGMLIFPALINTHDHLHLNCVPPLPSSRSFRNSYEWIEAYQPHFKHPIVQQALVIPESVRHWQGGFKNLLAGVTTVMHHDPWAPIFEQAGFPVRVVCRYGWAHSLRLKYGPSVAEGYCATAADTPWFIHLAEGTDAIAASELAELEALGCLHANTVIIHGVGLREADVDRVIGLRASVVWCPSSNLGMLGATLEPRRLFEAGRLALGTDSRLTGARDLLDELRIAADHSHLTPRDLLRLVTTDAARLLHIPDAGDLCPGMRADFLLLRHDSDPDPYRNLLMAHRADVCAVVRDGKPMIANECFAKWFAASQASFTRVMLDGRPKLVAMMLIEGDGCQAMELEPGLVLQHEEMERTE